MGDCDETNLLWTWVLFIVILIVVSFSVFIATYYSTKPKKNILDYYLEYLQDKNDDPSPDDEHPLQAVSVGAHDSSKMSVLNDSIVELFVNSLIEPLRDDPCIIEFVVGNTTYVRQFLLSETQQPSSAFGNETNMNLIVRTPVALSKSLDTLKKHLLENVEKTTLNKQSSVIDISLVADVLKERCIAFLSHQDTSPLARSPLSGINWVVGTNNDGVFVKCTNPSSNIELNVGVMSPVNKLTKMPPQSPYEVKMSFSPTVVIQTYPILTIKQRSEVLAAKYQEYVDTFAHCVVTNDYQYMVSLISKLYQL